jgi:menaquinone-dependent protoporphyrinogen oxidase
VKVLVTYGSHLGSTTAMAERIGAVLDKAGLQATVLPAATAAAGDKATGFDAFIIGGGTYAGRWHPDAVAFIRRHASVLLTKPVWLFSSGPLGTTPASEAREPVEIEELAPLVKARGHAVFSGAYDRDSVEGSELGRIERFVAKRFIPEGDWRDWPSIEAWARSIALELRPSPIGAL